MRKVYLSDLDITDPLRLHPIVRDTLSNPPKGYRYVNERIKQTDRKEGLLPLIAKAARLLPLPTMWHLRGTFDLAHVTSHLEVTRRPWIYDFESLHCMTRFDSRMLKWPHVRFLIWLFLSRKNCKCLVAMTEQAAKSMRHMFPSLAHKTIVVYPAPIVTPAMRKHFKERQRRWKSKKTHILFLYAARDFARKGGFEALEAFKILHKKHPDTRLRIVAQLPPGLDVSVPGVEFIDKVGRDDMLNIHYPEADVFVYPTFYDTFGYTLLEAMSYGLPIVSTDDFVIPEIVGHEREGLLVPAYTPSFMDENGISRTRYQNFDNLFADTRPQLKRMSQDLAKAMGRFIEDPRLLKRLGTAGFEKVTTGAFSMEMRKAALKKIYDEAFA